MRTRVTHTIFVSSDDQDSNIAERGGVVDTKPVLGAPIGGRAGGNPHVFLQDLGNVTASSRLARGLKPTALTFLVGSSRAAGFSLRARADQRN